MLKRLIFLLFFLPCLALAQDYPSYDNLYVNDQAGILSAETEATLTDELKALRNETGVEATVLTIISRWQYKSGGSIEEFATQLFNHWGIGDAERNDGILILVASEDREMRIALGSGYDRSFDAVAQDIIDHDFLPAFVNGDFDTGVLEGTRATIARIARPHAAGSPAEEVVRESGSEGSGSPLRIFTVAFAALFGVALFGRRLRDRFTRCPECGARGANSTSEVLESATYAHAGRGVRHFTCRHCGHVWDAPYTISRKSRSRSSSGGSSFGGGSSSGGGASGRW